MEANKPTYLVQRIFIGSKTPAEIIAEHLKASSQVLPLTTSATVPYNANGNCSVVRRPK